MTRKNTLLILFFIAMPCCLFAQTSIEATDKIANLFISGSQIFGAGLTLAAIIKIGANLAAKAITDSDRSQAENKDLLTKLGYLGVGLAMIFSVKSIVDFILNLIR